MSDVIGVEGLGDDEVVGVRWVMGYEGVRR